jgi:hypothetical protein
MFKHSLEQVITEFAIGAGDIHGLAEGILLGRMGRTSDPADLRIMLRTSATTVDRKWDLFPIFGHFVTNLLHLIRQEGVDTVKSALTFAGIFSTVKMLSQITHKSPFSLIFSRF